MQHVVDICWKLYFTHNALQTCTMHCAHQTASKVRPQCAEDMHNVLRAFSGCPQHVARIANAHNTLRAIILLKKQIWVRVITHACNFACGLCVYACMLISYPSSIYLGQCMIKQVSIGLSLKRNTECGCASLYGGACSGLGGGCM